MVCQQLDCTQWLCSLAVIWTIAGQHIQATLICSSCAAHAFVQIAFFTFFALLACFVCYSCLCSGIRLGQHSFGLILSECIDVGANGGIVIGDNLCS